MAEIPSNSYWRHHKGAPYYVLGVALNESNREEMVLYKGVGATVWVRPASEFVEKFTFLGPQPNDWGLVKSNG